MTVSAAPASCGAAASPVPAQRCAGLGRPSAGLSVLASANPCPTGPRHRVAVARRSSSSHTDPPGAVMPPARPAGCTGPLPARSGACRRRLTVSVCLVGYFRIRSIPIPTSRFASHSSRPTGSFRGWRFFVLLLCFEHQHRLSPLPPCCSLIYDQSGVLPILAQRDGAFLLSLVHYASAELYRSCWTHRPTVGLCSVFSGSSILYYPGISVGRASLVT